MEGKFSIIIDNGVPRVCAALETHDDVAVFGKHVGNFAFSLVAPVCAYDGTDHSI